MDRIGAQQLLGHLLKVRVPDDFDVIWILIRCIAVVAQAVHAASARSNCSVVKGLSIVTAPCSSYWANCTSVIMGILNLAE